MNLPINGDAFRMFCDHVFWYDRSPWENADFQHGNVVFCKIDEVWRLFRALRKTTARIVLVTGEGDKPVVNQLWDQKPPHVASWFGTNMFVDNSSAHPIPLGLGNASGKLTLTWEEIQHGLHEQVPRNRLLYANFGTASNPAIRGPLWDWVRRPEQSWITTENHSSVSGKAGYLKQLLSHRFVFCPPGNGEDTHRMWEALYCGAIPVVRKSPAMRAFVDLPVLFVDDLTAISPQFMEKTSKSLVSHSKEMLDLDYWKNQMENEKHILRAKGCVSPVEFLLAWFEEILRVARRRS